MTDAVEEGGSGGRKGYALVTAACQSVLVVSDPSRKGEGGEKSSSSAIDRGDLGYICVQWKANKSSPKKTKSKRGSRE